MAGTPIVAVRQAVTDGLATLAAFEDADVGIAWSPAWKKRIQVFTTRGQFTQEPSSMRAGATHRDERGTFELHILKEAPGKSASTVASDVADLGAAAEEWVASNRDVDVVGVNWLIVDGPGELTEIYKDSSVLAFVRYTLAYYARLD